MGKWSQEQHSHPESSLTVTVQLHCIRRQKFTQESIAVTVPELQQYNSSTVTFPTFFFYSDISIYNLWFHLKPKLLIFFLFCFCIYCIKKDKKLCFENLKKFKTFWFYNQKSMTPNTLEMLCSEFVQTVCGVWARLKIDKSLLMKDKSSSRKHTNPFSSEEASLLNDISSSKFSVL